MAGVKEIFSVLKKYRFPLTDEKVLQIKIQEAFLLNDLKCEREKRLSETDVIDFFFADTGIGVEIKVKKKLSAMAIYRQLERYAKNDDIKALVLVTGKAMGLPSEIEGKPIYYFHLSVNAL